MASLFVLQYWDMDLFCIVARYVTTPIVFVLYHTHTSIGTIAMPIIRPIIVCVDEKYA